MSSGFFRSLSSTTQKDKPRLYIALYPRGGTSFQTNVNCDSYHWSIIVGPQTAWRKDPGTRYHVAHVDHGDRRHDQHWFYEEQDMASSATAQRVLVRVAVAKVIDEPRLQSLLRELPVAEDDSAFSCLTWVKNAYLKLMADSKCLKSYLDEADWPAVERCAREYCKRKREQRRIQDQAATWDAETVSTFNFWENRETTL